MTNTLHVAPMHDLVDLAGCWCTLPRRQGAGGHPDAGRPAQGCRAVGSGVGREGDVVGRGRGHRVCERWSLSLIDLLLIKA
jgi:hypothetical protein